MAKWDKLLTVAANQVGYLEKRTNADLDSLTGNAGSANYTKYARDVDKTDFFNGAKQGYAWCAVFVAWCFINAYGLETARKMLYLPKKSYAAGVDYLKNYFKAAGRLYTVPQAGDVVMFGVQHTGIVVAVSGSTLTTIEGNTSTGAGVISNGGGVCRKSYTLNSTMTFGRPDWTLAEEAETVKSVSLTVPQLSKGSKNPSVEAVQAILNARGYACGTVDGDFGSKTHSAVKKYQAKKGLLADGIVGAQTWGKLLGQ